MNEPTVVVKRVALSALVVRYRDVERFAALCGECPNYGKNWACPPYDFDTGALVSAYSTAWLVGVKIPCARDSIATTSPDENPAKRSVRIFMEAKERVLDVLRAGEEKYPGAIALSAGGCARCAECARPRETCRFPGTARCSLESVGFDVSAIARDELGIDMHWAKGGMPPYLTIVNALLLREEEADGSEALGEAVRNALARERGK